MNKFSRFGAIIDRYAELIGAEPIVSLEIAEQFLVAAPLEVRKFLDIPISFMGDLSSPKLKITKIEYWLGYNAPANIAEYFNPPIDASKVELARNMGFAVLDPCPITHGRWAIVTPGVCQLFKIPFRGGTEELTRLVDKHNERYSAKPREPSHVTDSLRYSDPTRFSGDLNRRLRRK